MPPQFEDVRIPVCGESVDTLNRLELGAPEPVKGPVVITSRFSSENARVSFVRLSPRIFAAIVLPPINSSLSSSDQGYSSVRLVVRSMCITLPM